jgi:hypothetical protein
MPQVEICCWCAKEIEPDVEKFVMVNNSTAESPRRIAHLSCHQEREKKRGPGFVFSEGAEWASNLGERLGKMFRRD